MIAYHGDSQSKVEILKQLRAHARADQIVKGRYWVGGKGCAVGCTIHSGDHSEYEPRFGIPQMLAHLKDQIFEGLPNAEAKKWPVRFMAAIAPGADLSRVGWQFLHWRLTEPNVNPGFGHPFVRDSVEQCTDVLFDMANGKKVSESAAWNAESAARSAAWSTESEVWSVEGEAQCAALCAANAASAVWSTVSAVKNAAWVDAGRSAAWSAVRSMQSESSEVYVLMSKKLIALLKAAPSSSKKLQG